MSDSSVGLPSNGSTHAIPMGAGIVPLGTAKPRLNIQNGWYTLKDEPQKTVHYVSGFWDKDARVTVLYFACGGQAEIPALPNSLLGPLNQHNLKNIPFCRQCASHLWWDKVATDDLAPAELQGLMPRQITAITTGFLKRLIEINQLAVEVGTAVAITDRQLAQIDRAIRSYLGSRRRGLAELRLFQQPEVREILFRAGLPVVSLDAYSRDAWLAAPEPCGSVVFMISDAHTIREVGSLQPACKGLTFYQSDGYQLGLNRTGESLALSLMVCHVKQTRLDILMEVVGAKTILLAREGLSIRPNVLCCITGRTWRREIENRNALYYAETDSPQRAQTCFYRILARLSSVVDASKDWFGAWG